MADDVASWSPEDLDAAVDAYLFKAAPAPRAAGPSTGFNTAASSGRYAADDHGSSSALPLSARAAPQREASTASAARPTQGPRSGAGGSLSRASASAPEAAYAGEAADLDSVVDSILGATSTGTGVSPGGAAFSVADSTRREARGGHFDDDTLAGATPPAGPGSQRYGGSDDPDRVSQPRFGSSHSGRGSSEGGGSRRTSTAASAALRPDTELMLRRMSMWKARKERTIAEKRYEREAEEMAKCTFQPMVAEEITARTHSPERLLGPSMLYRDNKAWGTDEFIERQRKARQLREEQKQHEKEVFASGAAWRHRQTVPQPFHLGAQRHRAASSIAAGGPRYGGMTSVGAGSSRGMAKIVETVRRNFDTEPSRIEGPSVPPGAFSKAGAYRDGHGGRTHEQAAWNSQLDAMINEFL